MNIKKILIALWESFASEACFLGWPTQPPSLRNGRGACKLLMWPLKQTHLDWQEGNQNWGCFLNWVCILKKNFANHQSGNQNGHVSGWFQWERSRCKVQVLLVLLDLKCQLGMDLCLQSSRPKNVLFVIQQDFWTVQINILMEFKLLWWKLGHYQSIPWSLGYYQKIPSLEDWRRLPIKDQHVKP